MIGATEDDLMLLPSVAFLAHAFLPTSIGNAHNAVSGGGAIPARGVRLLDSAVPLSDTTRNR